MKRNKKLTEQRYFTETINYLRNQETRAMSSSEFCAYRGHDGTPCAVGYWIPDDLYDPDMEGVGNVTDIDAVFPWLHGVAWPDTEHGIQLAEALQGLHDMLEYRNGLGGGLSERGEAKAQSIAEKYKLTYTPPEGT